MWSTLKDRKFAWGFLFGVLVAGPVILAAMMAGGQAGADNLLAAATKNRTALETCTAALNENTEKLADLNSHWTLIMDTSSRNAVPAAQLLDGLVAIGPGKAFSAAGGPSPRWELPIKVTPYVAGPTDGAVYYYWDPKTREMDGPHAPLRSDGAQ
jgi:hypothetical protein